MMVESRRPITVHNAVEQVMQQVTLLDTEQVKLTEADGRILAEDITSDHDVPPFNRSPYDGFAIQAEDTKAAKKHAPVRLTVIETIGAGQMASQSVQTGQAIRIMTGAPIPEGADAVVMLEMAYEAGDGLIDIKRPFYAGDNISWQGEDTPEGTPLISSGQKIHPGTQAVMATFGYAQVSVKRQPVVGIIATGTELLEVDEPLEPGKIRNSNAYMIYSQVKKAGGRPVMLGQLQDDFQLSHRAVQQALDRVDVLITTGGVSVGDFDFLPAIYEKLGAEVLFNKVGMRPGSVTTVARSGDQLLFGLSGNPSACFVGFELFAAPYIKAMQGYQYPYLQTIRAVLDNDFPKLNPFTRFVRSQLHPTREGLAVSSTGLDKSNVVTSLAFADSLMVLPGGARGFQSGDTVDVLMLKEESGTFL